MKKERSVWVKILGILIFIFGIISVTTNLDFVKPRSQYKEELKRQIPQALNMMLNLAEQTSVTIEKKLKENLDPKLKQLYESKQIKTASDIKELKRYLQPEFLERNVTTVVNSRLLLLAEVLNFIFGVILLISSVGIFVHASWLGKLIYVTIPVSIVVYLSTFYVDINIQPLLMPQPPFWSNFRLLSSIFAVALLIGYNLFLYINFTCSKAKRVA